MPLKIAPMWKNLLTITLIFAASVVGIIVLSVYAFQRFNSYITYTEAVNDHYKVLEQLHELKIELIHLEDNQRGFLLFNDSLFLDRFNTHQQKILKNFSTLWEMVKADSRQKENLQKLNIIIRSRLDFLNSGITVGYPQIDYKKGQNHMDRAMGIFIEMEAYQNTILKEELKSKEFYESTTPKNFKIIFLLTLLVFLVSFVLLLQQYRDRRKYQEKLEKNIIELNQINSEWEQLAYVASHDLQEPLRKIRTFSDILTSRHLTNSDQESLTVVNRIEQASGRAQSLLTDIVNYTSIVKPREEISPVDLNGKLSEVLADLKGRFDSQGASLYFDLLPTISGFPNQLYLLFYSLLDNSLKFCKEGDPVKITIATSEVDAKSLPIKNHIRYEVFYKINVEDNGIGFENQFSEKIFKIFQRLHPQESPYDGRGIGLAMVKRIMTNHMGYVVARGRPGKGAIFTLYFPAR